MKNLSHTSNTSPAVTNTNHKELLKRTVSFAKDTRAFVSKTPRTLASLGDCRQLIKASGAIGAAYIEADQAVTRDSFLYRIQDCRKHARQCGHWLQLLNANLDERSETTRALLEEEALDLERTFGAIVGKMVNKAKAEKSRMDQVDAEIE